MDIYQLKTLFGEEFYYEEVSLALLNFDYKNYQRLPNMALINKMLNNLEANTSPHLAIAAKRSNNSIWVINGQHHALTNRAKNIETMSFFIFDSKGPDHEAIVFNKFQTLQKAQLLGLES